MRQLASVQKVLSLNPIPGADKIEVAQINGWSVVVQKGLYQAGDLCIYFEIDSFIPAGDARYASFAERFINWNGKQGMRVKTIRLRKQISQGLLMPLAEFPEVKNPVEGMDVTDILKIEKWEPAEETKSNAGGGGTKASTSRAFPFFLVKTDQERIQNRVNMLPSMANDTFEVTIKLDGSSMTVYALEDNSPIFHEVLAVNEQKKLAKMGLFAKLAYKLKKAFVKPEIPPYIAGVCSRNIELDLDDNNHFSQYVREHDLVNSVRMMNLLFNGNYAVQGELIAPSIQENYEQVAKPEFYVYSVYDIDNGCYMLPSKAQHMVHCVLGLQYVPVLYTDKRLSDFGDVVNNPLEVAQNIVAAAEGEGMNLGVKREGLVFKSQSRNVSFKAISQSYLLKKG